MNELARQFFKDFKQFRILNDEKELNWNSLSSTDLPRSWFELSRLSASDRISFVRDTWLNQLPFDPVIHEKLASFFSVLEEISIVLGQEKEGQPLSAEMVYSLAENRSFFRGLPPVDSDETFSSQEELGVSLPRDYFLFLQIHNGFGKLSSLGLFPCENIADMKRIVLEMLLENREPLRSGLQRVDPDSLIPFYEEEGLLAFQCFFTDWYPGNEMGNIYLSGIDYKISDTSDWKSWRENLAFPTFLEWLSEYLQGMSLSL
ncbi:MAG: SMI1/KNR4 family protein [Chlamydiia bacterium]|nr:SMI1/KNR4 family protein [Chlamydiia bacterium]